MRFAVSVVTPFNYPHSAAFDEVALTLQYGLQALGHDAVVSTRLDNRKRRHLVLGANLLQKYPAPVPDDAVFYNLEQISPDSAWFKAGLIDVLRTRPCWDYSRANAAALAHAGADVRAVLPLGYAPALTRIAPAEEDIDVLFYGSLNERRAVVLRELTRRGLRVKHLFGVYGTERDAWIARARIVLNMHYFEAKVFEAVRVTYLLANRRFVVSERGCDSAEEANYADGVAFSAYDDLADTCDRFLAQPHERRRVADAGFDLMQHRPIETLLAPALASL